MHETIEIKSLDDSRVQMFGRLTEAQLRSKAAPEQAVFIVESPKVIQVALDAGLIVPVIRDADKMSLDAISEAAKDLATRAKENKLGADEYKGSTFTVSNLGMFGIETFTPIINQPDAAILGVCAIEDELALKDGQVEVRKVMRLSCTLDHRLLDGAVVAKFEMDLRDLLQSPMSILV